MSQTPMYNQEIKEEYLKYCSETKDKTATSNIRFSFGDIYEIEQKFNRDVAQLSSVEIYENLFEDDYPIEVTARKRMHVISEYKNWCHEHGKFSDVNTDTLSYMDMPDDVLIRSMEKFLYADPKDMLDDLLKLYSFTNGHPQIPVCCLFWEGLQVKEIAALKDGQVDLIYGKIYNKDRNVIVDEIDPEVADVLALFKQTRIGTRGKVVPWSDVPHPHTVYPINNGYFITPFRKDLSDVSPLNFVNVENKLFRAQKEYFDRTGEKLRLWPKNIALSGRMRRLWKAEARGVDLYSLSLDQITSITRKRESVAQTMRQYECYKQFTAKCNNAKK